MENEVKKLNLFQKIQAVSMDIMNIEKNMTVGSGNYGYKAVSDFDVTLAVKQAEAKYGLISIPVKQELINSEIVRTLDKDNKEKLTFVDTIKMTVRIIDTDFESENSFIEVESFGKGIDSGDKGFGKASTYARKYALLNAYKIATGEDPDTEKSETKTTISENEKLNKIKEVCFADNATMQNVLSHFNIGELDLLTKDQINAVYNNFKTKKKI